MEPKLPEVIRDPGELQRRLKVFKKEGKTIGLVPTMGALHYGHLSLAIAAKNDCDVTVVSVFVNPIQFAPNEDYDQYPRTLDADLELLSQIGVDFVFAPDPQQMYPRGFSTGVHVGGPLTEVLEGSFRPTHFDGVATVVLKLFQVSMADVAYFGQKDFQQLAVVKHMVHDLNVPIEIIGCPIIREQDGLAMSSRNKYLDKKQRKDALVLYESLTQAEYLIHSGQRNVEVIKATIRSLIEAVPDTKIDYICVADPETLREMETVAGNVVVLLAVRFGQTRLIDNMVIEPAPKN